MKKTILTLTLSFFVVFSGLAVTGAYIVYSEATYAQTKNSNDSSGNTGVKVEVKSNSATFEITNAIPGLIVLFLGVSGLILMLIKVPIREALISNIDNSKDISSKKEKAIMHGNCVNRYKGMSNRKYRMREPQKIPLPVLWTLRLYTKFRK